MLRFRAAHHDRRRDRRTPIDRHSAAELVGRVEGAENVSRFHDKHLPIADIEIINFFVCRRATKVGPFPV
jgi:hypothetical protein